MAYSVYLETTVISYLTARQSRDLVVAAHQEITREWWRDAAEDLADSLVSAAAVPPRASEDAARPHRAGVPRIGF